MASFDPTAHEKFGKYIRQQQAAVYQRFCRGSKNSLLPATSYRDRIPIAQTLGLAENGTKT